MRNILPKSLGKQYGFPRSVFWWWNMMSPVLDNLLQIFRYMPVYGLEITDIGTNKHAVGWNHGVRETASRHDWECKESHVDLDGQQCSRGWPVRGTSPKERSKNVFRGREKAKRESFYWNHTTESGVALSPEDNLSKKQTKLLTLKKRSYLVTLVRIGLLSELKTSLLWLYRWGSGAHESF